MNQVAATDKLLSRVCRFVQSKRFLNRRVRRVLPACYPFRVHQRLSVFLDTKDLGGPSFYLAYGGPAAFYHYEEKLKSTVLEHLPADGVFLDLGANVGIHSWFIANHFPMARVFAFEPDRNLQRCILSTIEANGFENVTLVPSAIGNRDGEETFWTDPRSSGGNSLVRESIGSRARKTPVPVPVRTLDSFVRENRVERVDVVKIDVQDAEDLVLEGAKRTIEKFRPVMIVETSAEKLARGGGALFNLPSDYWAKEVGARTYQPLENLVSLGSTRSQRHLDIVVCPRERSRSGPVPTRALFPS